MQTLDTHRQQIRLRYKETEEQIVQQLLAEQNLSARERAMLEQNAADVVVELRKNNDPTIMESFLSEYGLSTREGVGLMCLAEALLRVPDPETIDELIADKIEPSNWGVHLGKSSSSLVNASTWALLLTGQILDDGSDKQHPVAALRGLVKRLGEPVVRTAVSQAMKMLGTQFVLGQSIDSAVKEARKLENKGYTYSYDMLGEAARTNADAEYYFNAYATAIKKLASSTTGDSVAERAGISIKLSALHPRYEYTHKDLVMKELLPRIAALVDMAAEANIGLNIDAEEADRLDLSLDIIDALLTEDKHSDWQGFGIVIQAYSRRALPVIDWVVAACRLRKRRMMIRLVKGAYWDAEIKISQELGLANFPVYTRKAITDLSYMVCAQRLLDNRDVLYPQFATHNAHTVCAIRYLAGNDATSYEFQRLHGMGESLHENIKKRHNTRCRIYAPVGAHKDLLAYLVRRLLENGANSSFVNQIVNTDISPQQVARCPISEVESYTTIAHPAIKTPLDMYLPERVNSKGYRVNDPASISALLEARETFADAQWDATPLTAEAVASDRNSSVRYNPSNTTLTVGNMTESSIEEASQAIQSALNAQPQWQAQSVEERGQCLLKAADLYEENIAQFSALACREAGKTINDAIAEVREAVDFLRYYAAQAANEEASSGNTQARGVIVCISPWNFPLAIFSGQIAAALASGNAVVAKPAEQAPAIATLAVSLLHSAGVPIGALQLVVGDGPTIGNALTSDPRIAGVCFTGSTSVAKLIERKLVEGKQNSGSQSLAETDSLLIAETGGLNAMIADTTALTEQVIRDVIASAFQSAGQRCSALRLIYIQEEAEARFTKMLLGAMDSLVLGDPWQLSTDVGPVIDEEAQQHINDYIEKYKSEGKLLKQLSAPSNGYFVGPAAIKVSGIEELEEEIFGPVLHIATFKAEQLSDTIERINQKGYGLTFGLHTRIDDRVQTVVDSINAGNIYVNRNQIGAIVGSQPFGGEGLSGTGPKAGGPHYVPHFYQAQYPSIEASSAESSAASVQTLEQLHAALQALPEPSRVVASSDSAEQQAIATLAKSSGAHYEAQQTEWILPGPTGESNRLTVHPRGRVLLISSDESSTAQQCIDALSAGCSVLVVGNAIPAALLTASKDKNLPLSCLDGSINHADLASLEPLDVVACHGDAAAIQHYKLALTSRAGKMVPVICSVRTATRYCLERHVCIDTTAAGGNATLLAASDSE